MTRQFFYSASVHGFFISDMYLGEMPVDVVEITEEQHTALFAGQSQGKIIVAGEDGYPTLADMPPPSEDEIRLYRNAMLRDCDWTQADDVPQAVKDKWATYRQALRDVPQQEGFPETFKWPVKPE